MACLTRPTRREKQLLAANRKQPENWLKKKDLGTHIEFVHRKRNSVIKLAK